MSVNKLPNRNQLIPSFVPLLLLVSLVGFVPPLKIFHRLESVLGSRAVKAASGQLPRFLEVTEGAQLVYSGKIYNASWTDVNNDFYPDLYVTQHFLAPFLFINRGNGTFREESASYGIYAGRDRHGATFGDINNDGWVDLYQTSGAGRGKGISYKELFLQIPDAGRFANIADVSGAQSLETRGRTVNLVDFDNDGDLDVFLTDHAGVNEWSEGRTCLLFRNEGNNQFTNVSEEVGFTDTHGSQSSVWGDFDNDGDLDLIVSGNTWDGGETPEYACDEPTIFYENRGGRFIDVTADVGISHDYRRAMSALFADFDNDCDLDLFFPARDGGEDIYYENRDGWFVSRSARRLGINIEGGFKMSASAVDFDNDGDLDIFVARGGGLFSPLYRNLLVESGDLAFEEVHEETGLITSERSQSHSHAWADYDNDGFQDLVFLGGAWSPGGIHLYKNKANHNSFLKIKLVGTQSNRDGIGAKITLMADGKTQFREKEPGGNFYSQGDPFVHFGLGSSPQVDRLIIDWPSGIHQEFAGIPANHFIILTEGESSWQTAQVSLPESNMLENSTFEGNRVEPWRLVLRGDGSASAAAASPIDSVESLGNRILKIESDSPGDEPRSVTVAQGPFSVEEGKIYRATFWARANTERSIQVVLRRAHKPWGILAEETKHLKPFWTRYNVDLVPNETGQVNLCFDLGGDQFPIMLDNIIFEEKPEAAFSPLYPHPQRYLAFYGRKNPAGQLNLFGGDTIDFFDFLKLVFDGNYSPAPPQGGAVGAGVGMMGTKYDCGCGE